VPLSRLIVLSVSLTTVTANDLCKPHGHCLVQTPGYWASFKASFRGGSVSRLQGCAEALQSLHLDVATKLRLSSEPAYARGT
jgi:hypothetical protein